MSINDSTLCVLAKKLHGIAPTMIIDDAVKVEAMLVDWTKKFISGSVDPTILSDEDDEVLSAWFRDKRKP